jgi:glycosyltransferase involved in cell wall biosynthesis
MPALLAINNYNYRRGGAEVVFLEQRALLQQQGWKCVPFSMQHPLNLPDPASSHFVDEIEFGGDYSLGQKLTMAARVVYSRQAQVRLRELLATTRFDVAHAHNIYHHLSPSILPVLRAAGLPVVLTLHDLKLACPSYKMMVHGRICERCRGGRIWNVVAHRCVKDSLALSALIGVETAVNRLLGSYARNVSRFVVPSRFLLDKMVEWGWPRERFCWIPNFVECADFEAGRPVGSEFVFVGRLSSEKGVATLVRAAAAAGVPVALVGAGPQEGELRELSQSLAAPVRFLGYQSGAELREIIGTARAIVLPSEVYENAPMSILEAYAAGRPVVGARIGGIPELVREGETGVTFASGDVAGLAASLRELASAPDSRLADMGRAGRAWVERDFTPARHRDLLLELYRSLGVAC